MIQKRVHPFTRTLVAACIVLGMLAALGCASSTPEDRDRRIKVCVAKLAAHRAAVASGTYEAELARIEDPEKRARAENYLAASNLLCEELLAYYAAAGPGDDLPAPPVLEPDDPAKGP